MVRCAIVILIWFILLQIFTYSVTAATINFTSSQSEMGYDQELTIQASLNIQASDETNYYLRGVFYKEGSSNYCGLTWNGGEWFGGPYSSDEGWKKFLKVSVSNNSWSGELKAKIDQQDSGCQESGSFKFRIQRFNEGSGSSHFDDQNELTINIVIPTPTPTSSPTPKPQPTSKPTATPKPESNHKPTTDSKLNIEKSNIFEEAKVDVEFEVDNDDVLGASDSGDITNLNEMLINATNSSDSEKSLIGNNSKFDSSHSSRNKSPFITIGGIFSILASCGILVMRKFRRT